MDDARAKIVVAVEAGGPELCGTVCAEQVPDQPFTGWLGLLGALQIAVATMDPREVKA